MRESKIEAYLVERVKDLGGEVRKVAWPGRRGAPDRLVMLPERHEYCLNKFARPTLDVSHEAQTIWVELKATGVAPEAHQLREHERLQSMGQRVEVIDSIAAVDKLLGLV